MNPNTTHHRWTIAGRVAVASLGGYAVCALSAAVLALALPRLAPMSPAMAVTVSTLLSFVFYTAVAIWVFGVRSAVRAWISVGVATLALGALYLALRGAT